MSQLTTTTACTAATLVPYLPPPGALLTFSSWKRHGRQLGIADAPPLAGMAVVRALATCDEPELDGEFHELFADMAHQIAPPETVAHALAFADGYVARVRSTQRATTGATGVLPMAKANPLTAAVEVAARAFADHDHELGKLKQGIEQAGVRMIELSTKRARCATPLLPMTAPMEQHLEAARTAADETGRIDAEMGYFKQLAKQSASGVIAGKHRVLEAETTLASALREFWTGQFNSALDTFRAAVEAPLLTLIAAADRVHFSHCDMRQLAGYELLEILNAVTHAPGFRQSAAASADALLAQRPQRSSYVAEDERRRPDTIRPVFGNPTRDSVTALEDRLQSLQTNRDGLEQRVRTDEAELARLVERSTQLELLLQDRRTQQQHDSWTHELNSASSRLRELQRHLPYDREVLAGYPEKIATTSAELEAARNAYELAAALAA